MMTTETLKGLKAVPEDWLQNFVIGTTANGQFWVFLIRDSGKNVYLGCNGSLVRQPYYHDSLAAAEQALAKWKAANIPWLTWQAVHVCAQESGLAAIECSIIHWKQIAAAGLRAYNIATGRGDVSIGPLFCAICQRAKGAQGLLDCSKCPLGDHTHGCGCDPEWNRVSLAIRDDDPSRFDITAAAMVSRLEAERDKLLVIERATHGMDIMGFIKQNAQADYAPSASVNAHVDTMPPADNIKVDAPQAEREPIAIRLSMDDALALWAQNRAHTCGVTGILRDKLRAAIEEQHTAGSLINPHIRKYKGLGTFSVEYSPDGKENVTRITVDDREYKPCDVCPYQEILRKQGPIVLGMSEDVAYELVSDLRGAIVSGWSDGVRRLIAQLQSQLSKRHRESHCGIGSPHERTHSPNH